MGDIGVIAFMGGVQALELRVQGLRFRVWGLGLLV